jgi:hypothetical protein
MFLPSVRYPIAVEACLMVSQSLKYRLVLILKSLLPPPTNQKWTRMIVCSRDSAYGHNTSIYTYMTCLDQSVMLYPSIKSLVIVLHLLPVPRSKGRLTAVAAKDGLRTCPYWRWFYGVDADQMLTTGCGERDEGEHVPDGVWGRDAKNSSLKMPQRQWRPCPAVWALLCE